MPSLLEASFVKALKEQRPGAKIGRDAFLYLEPEGDGKDFAQCSTCYLYVADEQRCAILGPDFEVLPQDTCGLYLQGIYEGTPVRKLVSPEDADYARRKVRCENCYYGGAKCQLFVTLNKRLPELFKLEETIKAKGCCNANTPGAKGE
jgi:hypothetical protein